ncbi:MAG TPA: hypothetical protein VEQ61_01505 [Thermoleophilaceae bacterium]|nr:hypothetical protein [Thermoleophilaceae bacterium]
MLALRTTVAQFLDPGRGPDQDGGFEVDPSFFVLVLVLGFVVGALGHLIRSRALVAVGIFMIFGATLLIPLALSATR